MEYKLEECTLNITDGTHSTVIDNENGKNYLLSCKNIKNGNVEISKNDRKIDDVTLKKLRKRTNLEKGDVLITTVGTLGEMAIIKENNINYDFQRSVGILKPNPKIVIPEYLYYAMKNNLNNILNVARGTSQQCIFLSELKNVTINIMDKNIQKKIVKILSNIDKKIELNNQINNNLSEIEKCYFQKLFKTNSNYQIIKLDELCNISAGGDAPKEKSNIKSEKYNIPIISNSIDNDGIYGYTDKSKINTKSITISARGTIGFKVLRNYAYYPIVRLISLVPKTDRVSAEYIFYILDEISINSTGTTQQQLTVPMVKDLKVKIFNKELIDIFTMFSINLNNKIENNKIEIKNLEQLRDTLLPKLMNGEMDLDKIEI